MIIRPAILGAAFSALVWPALAQTSGDCSPNDQNYDVCEAARTLQQVITPRLPMRVSAEMTITTIVVDGPRLVMTATWEVAEVEFNQQLALRNLSADQFKAKMQLFTRNMVCGQKVSAAFLNLGGEVQYNYVTNDAHPVASPVIQKCD
jgi:hypothetical protein